jgi:hypothetical protein
MVALLGAGLVAIACIEIVLRLSGPPPWLHRWDLQEGGLMRPHPVRGYALAPGLNRRWRSEDFDVSVHTNEIGLRDSPLRAAKDAEIRVVAAGNSFTFGIGVEAHETWPEVLESHLSALAGRSVTVLNAGVPGYSARQIRQVIQSLARTSGARLAIFGMYAPTHWRVENPYVLRGTALLMSNSSWRFEAAPSGDLLISDLPRGRLRTFDIWLKRHFFLGARVLSSITYRTLIERLDEVAPDNPPDPELAYQPAFDEILQTHDWLQERQIPLVVLIINHQESNGEMNATQFNRLIRSFCTEHGIHVVDPLPELRARSAGAPVLRFSGDMHWTPLAHQIAAGQLLEYIEHSELLSPR